jgi:hypothetical protein
MAHPDDGGSTHLWNVGLLKTDYTALFTRTLSSSYDIAVHVYGLDHVSELQPLMGLLFIHQMTYEDGEPRWNDTERVKPKN